MFGFFRRRPYESPQATAHSLTAEQQQYLLDRLSAIGLRILAGARGPVPLLTFARRVSEYLDYPPPVPLPHFAAALKCLIQNMDHEHLRILSPSDMLGVGYVYNAADPDTWPVRHYPTIPSAAAL